MKLHWKILIGLFGGIVFGLIFTNFSWGTNLVIHYIKPFGTIFINLLKLMAIPIILASLIHGIASLNEVAKLKKLGTRTIAWFVGTTLIAAILGLIIVSVVKPGNAVGEETQQQLLSSYQTEISSHQEMATKVQDRGPLQFIVDIVPDNIFDATTSNKRMLQVIFFAILFGLGIAFIPADKSKPIRDFFSSFNDVGMKMIDFVMAVAPYGVFALLAAIVVEAPSIDLFSALGLYALTVIVGLIILVALDTFWVKLFTGRSPKFFLSGIAPAQLVAFSASSSAATLPVTMERTKNYLGVAGHIRSFVLPIGATVNMDGTCLYQGVSAVFIAQALGMDLSLSAQIGIILTTTLASIGTAPVPGAGFVTLVIVLAQAGIPEAGLALVVALDRPLNMCRTLKNITGDAAISMIVAKPLGGLKKNVNST